MNARLLNLWYRIRASYWLVPALMSVAAVGMVAGAYELDRAIAGGAGGLEAVVYGGGPAGARTILSTIAGSMITVAGVAFSTTMVALVLASSEFGPRVLENFMRDRGNQVVLGSFICTFLYCVLALRLVRSPPGETFVPRITVTVGIGLSVLSVGLFIYFIHHVIRLIQAPNIVARVGTRLDQWIDAIFPEQEGSELPSPGPAPVARADRTGTARPAEPDDSLPDWCGDGPDDSGEGRTRPVEARESGYLQTLDHDRLVELAARHDAVVRLSVRPGEFVVQGTVLVEVLCRDVAPDDFPQEVRDAFVVGDQRTPAQDPEFVVHQLVEIAVRALSTGTNDPYTAVNCLDRLGAALVRIAGRPRSADRVRGPDGRVRLLRDPIDFPELACAALDPIREYGRQHEEVLVRLLQVLDALVDRVRRHRDLEEIRWHAEKVVQSGQDGLPDEPSREVLADRYEELLTRIEERADRLSERERADVGDGRVRG